MVKVRQNVKNAKIDRILIVDDLLRNVRITVGDSDEEFDDPPAEVICSYIPGQPSGDVFEMFCGRVMLGRYVRVTAVNINWDLNMYEMEVYGWE